MRLAVPRGAMTEEWALPAWNRKVGYSDISTVRNIALEKLIYLNLHYCGQVLLNHVEVLSFNCVSPIGAYRVAASLFPLSGVAVPGFPALSAIV
jgi:hypothetical protein